MRDVARTRRRTLISNQIHAPNRIGLVLQCRSCGAELHDEDLRCPKCDYGDSDNLLAQAQRLWVNGEKELALEALTTAVRLDSSRADIWYEKAKYECRRGLLEEAITSLEVACSVDGSYVTLAEFCDSEFVPLRASPRFQELAKRRKEELSFHPARPPAPIAIQNLESRRCRECGAKLRPENKFCPNCDAYQP